MPEGTEPEILTAANDNAPGDAARRSQIKSDGVPAIDLDKGAATNILGFFRTLDRWQAANDNELKSEPALRSSKEPSLEP